MDFLPFEEEEKENKSQVLEFEEVDTKPGIDNIPSSIPTGDYMPEGTEETIDWENLWSNLKEKVIDINTQEQEPVTDEVTGITGNIPDVSEEDIEEPENVIDTETVEEGVRRFGHSLREASQIVNLTRKLEDLTLEKFDGEKPTGYKAMQEEADIKPETGIASVDAATDFLGSVGGTLFDFGTLSQLVGPAAGLAPNVIQPGLRFAGVRTARTGLSEMAGEDVEGKDYAKAGVGGFVGGEAGALLGEATKHLSTMVPLSDTVYPWIQQTISGAGTGAGFTAADYLFDPEDTSLADLGVNMASMAIMYSLPLLSKNKRAKINQARKNLIQAKALKENAKRDAFRKLGLSKDATKQQVKNRWKQVSKKVTQGNLKNLSEKEKVNILSDTKQAREEALKAINNMPLSTKIKNTLSQKLNQITTGIARKFTGTTTGALVPVEQQATGNQVMPVRDFIKDIGKKGMKPEQLTKKLTTQEAAGMLMEPTDSAQPIELTGEVAMGEPVEMPGEVLEFEDAGAQAGQITEETEQQGETTSIPDEPQIEADAEPQAGIAEGDRVKWTTDPVQGETTTYEGIVRQIQPAGEEGNRIIIETAEGQQIRGFDYKGDIEVVEKAETVEGAETDIEQPKIEADAEAQLEKLIEQEKERLREYEMSTIANVAYYEDIPGRGDKSREELIDDLARIEAKKRLRIDQSKTADIEQPEIEAEAEPQEGVDVEETAELEPIEPAATGETDTVVTPQDTEVEVQYEVADADQLITSHDEDLREVEEFPEELQPRDRSKAATEEQIQEIYNRLDPERLGKNRLAAHGAPIIGSEGLVEVGNARTIALKRSYRDNTENIEQYKNWLKENADRFGLDPEQIEQVDKPVLVRERKTDIDRQRFTQEANIEETARMSPVEQGQVDAQRLTPELLNEFEPHPGGRIDHARNQDFKTDFLDQVVGTAQKGQYIDAEGNLNQEGIKRIKSAIFSSAYDDPEIAADLLEATDSNIRNITGAMMEAAPKVVDIKQQINKGQIPDLDISNDLTNAVKLYKSAKTEFPSVKDYVDQQSLFERNYNELEEKMARILDQNKRSKKRMREVVQNYQYGVEGLDIREDMDSIFPEMEKEPPTKLEMLEAAYRKMARGYESVEPSEIFGQSEKAEKQKVLFSQEQTPGSREVDTSDVPSGEADVGGYDTDIETSAIGMPEMVELTKAINEGKYPHIKEKLRGQAIGRFASDDTEGDIKLQGDIFIGPVQESYTVEPDNLREFEKELSQEYEDQEDIIIKKRYNKNQGNYEVNVYKEDPGYANKVLMHEVGHLVDWLPDKNLSRGNIIGRIASLKESYRKKAYEDIKTNKKIRQELINLSQKWKPYDQNNEKVRKYRESSKELYADAVSVLGNNPQMLKEMAPTFYKNFMNYLENKPEVKAKFEDIQNRVKFRREQRGEYLLNQQREMFQKDRERRQELQKELNAEQEGRIKQFLDSVTEQMIEKDYQINRYAEESIESGSEEQMKRATRARSMLEESRYIASEVQNYLIDITNEIDSTLSNTKEKADFGVVLLNNRIINERSKMGNPQGIKPEDAKEALNALKNDIGKEKYKQYQQLAKKFDELRQELVINRLEESRAYRPELIEYMKNNHSYAKYEVTHYLNEQYGQSNTGKIYKQVGTFADIGNPYIATILNDISLLRAAHLNSSKLASTSMMLNDFPGEIEEAKTRFVNNHLEAIEPKDSNKGLLTVMLDGEVQSYYVPKNVAESFEFHPQEASIIAKTFSKGTQFIKDLYVAINPGWIIRNVPRDIQNTIIKNQELKPRHFIKYGRYLKQGFKEAAQLIDKNQKSADVEEMMKEHILPPSRMYSDVELNVEDELQKLQYEFELLAEKHNERIEEQGKVRKFIKTVNVFNRGNPYHQWMNKKGQISELGTKIAGYKFLKKETDLPKKEIGHRVRTRVGTPDYKRQGKAQHITNSVFLYSNISKEDVRSHVEAMKDAPFSWMWKTTLFNILPKVLLVGAKLFAAQRGVEWLEKCIGGMTDYDKKHNTVVPLGVDKNGNSNYLSLAQNHLGSKIGAAVWAAKEGNFFGKDSVASNLWDVSPYKLSNINHMVMGMYDLTRYLFEGAIPYDYFRGKMAFPDYLKKGEGGWKSFAAYEWGKLGGDLFYDPYRNIFADTTYEKLTSYFPFSIITSILRNTDYGHQKDNDSGYGY